MPALPQSGPDVLETQRLDAEERTETETLVSGIGPQQKDIHEWQ
jgi:hypothetical protein